MNTTSSEAIVGAGPDPTDRGRMNERPTAAWPTGPRARPWAEDHALEGNHRGLPLQVLLEITKARLVSLVLWSVAVGFFMASRGPLDWPLLLRALGGTALIAGGAMALNQLLEVESDAKMKRTENRPLPSGRISPRAVLFVGIFLSASGLLVLTTGVNLLTGFLAALTLGTYLFVYTPLKTKTSLCTLAGAIPGAAPPLLGWAAAGGELNSAAWVLFGILFVWQLPHVLAVSWVYREDYGRAGFQMLAVKDLKGETVSALIVFYSSLLLFLSLLPSLTKITGPNYFLSSLLLGTWFFGLAFLTSLDLERRAKSFFKASIFYLALLFLFLILDKKIL